MIVRNEDSTETDGRIIVPKGVNVWPHELETARALAKAGHSVEFIRRSERKRETTADCLLDGIKWEMKAPNGAKLSLVEKNLRRGIKQCDKIIFDSHRVKRIPDKAIARELAKWSTEIRGLQRLKFVNRHGEIIDIR